MPDSMDVYASDPVSLADNRGFWMPASHKKTLYAEMVPSKLSPPQVQPQQANLDALNKQYNVTLLDDNLLYFRIYSVASK